VIATAMVVNLVVAGLAGILIPVALDRLGIDPALASGAFVTTVTDVVGFFAFLGLAVRWCCSSQATVAAGRQAVSKRLGTRFRNRVSGRRRCVRQAIRRWPA
jgi:hypothetical protein